MTGATVSKGAPSLVTVPENVHDPELPALSVAWYEKKVRPRLTVAQFELTSITAPLRRRTTTSLPEATVSTLSVGVMSPSKLSRREVAEEARAITPVSSEGHDTTGGSRSDTIMSNEQVAALLEVSRAVQVIDVVPRGKTVREDMDEQDVVDTPTLSEVVGRVQETVPVVNPGLVLTR
jgi:hypothetical protein